MCLVNEKNCIYRLRCTQWSVFLVLCAEQQLKCLFGGLFTSGYFHNYSEGQLIVFPCARKVFRKFCPLCYKQVIALSPCRIKDQFHLYFQSFNKLPSSLRDSGNFVKTLKMRENLSLILLGLMRLHIQTCKEVMRARKKCKVNTSHFLSALVTSLCAFHRTKRVLAFLFVL